MKFHVEIERVGRPAAMLMLCLWMAAMPLGRADCDVCQEKSLVACHTQNTFSICVDGYPSHEYITCPPNYVCSSESPAVCLPEESAVASCTPSTDTTRCGVCNEPHQAFACLDEKTVSLCLGTERPSETAISFCPEDTVCDLNNRKEFCTDISRAKASCVANLSDTTTICQLFATADGVYVDILDETCKTYVYCSKTSGQWVGTIGTCKGYFNRESKTCKSTIPDNCAASARTSR